MPVEMVRVEGLEGVLKTLEMLPPEIVSKRGGPVRRSLRKASKLLVDRMKANVQRIIDEPNKGGSVDTTGLAVANIVTLRQKMPAGIKGERYKVGPRLRKKYPKASPNAKIVTVVQNLRQLETGTERRDPMPWARPAFDAEKSSIPPMFAAEINKDLGRIVKKLARANGVA